MQAGATVVDLRKRRIERLADELAPQLLHGYVIVEAHRIDSVDEWRAAARVVARRGGWKVRTGMSQGNGRVFAVRVDPEAEKGLTGWSCSRAATDCGLARARRRRDRSVSD